MMLRPIPAPWFELVTVHEDLAGAIEGLSRTGAVELEAQSQAQRLPLPDLDEPIEACRELARRYQAYLPPPASQGRRRPENFFDTLDSAHRRLAAWRGEADPIITALERRSRETTDLEQLKDALTHSRASFPDLELLAEAGPRLRVRLLRLPAGTTLGKFPALVLFDQWRTPSANYVLLVGRHADMEELEAQLHSLEGRVVPLPVWLPSSVADATSVISKRLAGLSKEIENLNGDLAALSERLQIARALGDIALIEWLNPLASELRGSGRLAWITGWTSDIQGAALRRALDADGVRYVLRVSDAPIGANAPVLLSNPRWARVFEVFARMLGTPARDETDPSLIVALVAPLIFGFMFGDVGQGLVVFAAGLVLGRRIAFARMLVPGGIMAGGFGVLFGSVFCREDVIPALWIRPLADPAMLLVAAIFIGVVVLSIGIALDAVQDYWRGEAHRWWGYRAGLPIAYFGLLVSAIWSWGLILIALGAGWRIIGSVMFAPERTLVVVARAVAEFVEQSLRLLINTISFARVGAFALAHAGLAAAIVGVADASGSIGYWLVLAFGNVLIIAIEGLVVSIQTTRLMLFEFFIRFLAARGRGFKALSPPEIARTSFLQPCPGSAS